jgi:hypothetical protein
MKKQLIHTIVIGAIVIMFIFSGCFSSPEPYVPPTGMTAEETVQFYFEQWNNKSEKASDSIVREGLRGNGRSNPAFVGVKLIKCVDETEKHLNLEREYFSSTYPEYVNYAIMEVKFEIEYKKEWFFDDAGGFDFGKNVVSDWRYVLGKKDADSDWEILGWGVS